MNSNTLEHLKLLDAHLNKLLEQASKRTPGKWTWKNKYSGSADILEPRIWLGESTALPRQQPHQNAAFITSCAGNAEAGWRATKAAIAHIMSGGRGHDNGEDLMAESILAAWPLELLETKP